MNEKLSCLLQYYVKGGSTVPIYSQVYTFHTHHHQINQLSRVIQYNILEISQILLMQYNEIKITKVFP